MTDLLDRLITQLDSLISFLALSNEDAYAIIRDPHGALLTGNERQRLPDTFALYQAQVAHSAFLLRFSYAEAFLSDLVREMYHCRPEMLPRDKQLTFGDVLEQPDFDAVLSFMINREVFAVFYNSMEKIIEYFERKLHLQWPTADVDPVVEASLLRNCIIHNNARVDARLALRPRWSEGAPIVLSASDVHTFGMAARRVARSLHQQATAKFSRRSDFHLPKNGSDSVSGSGDT